MMILEQPSPWPAELIFKPGVHFSISCSQKKEGVALPRLPIEFVHLDNPPSVGH